MTHFLASIPPIHQRNTGVILIIVIRVNGEAIEDSAIQHETTAMLNVMAARMQDEDPLILRARAREWAEENLIEAALLRQAALRELEPPQIPVGCSRESEDRLRMESLVNRITSHAAPPRHKEIVAYYLKNRDSFHEAETARVAHIVKNVDERASEEIVLAAMERARDDLAAGRSFGEIADEISDCPGKGGELAWFGRGEMVAAFEDAVFSLSPNEVSGIIRTEFGFHIAKLLELRPAGIRRLEEVTDQISRHLLEEKKQKRLHQYVDSLRARAAVQREEMPGA